VSKPDSIRDQPAASPRIEPVARAPVVTADDSLSARFGAPLAHAPRVAPPTERADDDGEAPPSTVSAHSASARRAPAPSPHDAPMPFAELIRRIKEAETRLKDGDSKR
jgi:hypothetical protein